MTKFGIEPLPTMESVFKQHPRPEVKQGLLRNYRLQATEVLQQGMPDTILRLQALIAKEDDPTSPLWGGQVNQGQYLAQNIQLDLRRKFPAPGGKSATVKSAAIRDGDQILEGQEEEDTALEPHQDGQPDGESDGGDFDEENLTSKIDGDKQDSAAGGLVSGGGIKPGTSYPFALEKNKVQAEVVRIVVEEAERLYFQLNTLRVWLSLETPVIEDGNSFGADVQSHLVEKVNKYFQRVGAYIDGMNRHHVDRRNIIRQWVQMPNMADCPASIAASDRMDHVLARQYLRNMLMSCGSLLVDFEKNWEKVINPKGREQGSGAMY